MTRTELQKLRDLPIEEVAERLGLHVDRHKSLCPFHDDHHASLSFSTRTNTCRCFVCMDKPMGTIDLVMRHTGKNFPQACQWLSETAAIPLASTLRHNHPATTGEERQPARPAFDASRYEPFFRHPHLTDEARRFLYDERHLDPRVVRWCRLTSFRDKNGTPWLQIPYYDTRGQLVGLQNRNLQPGSRPRFRFPYGSMCGIYNLPVVGLLKPHDELLISEGCSDCWAMLSAGHKAIAIPSATLLSPRDKDFLAQLSASVSPSFHMYPDRDLPGERLYMQLKEILPTLQHHHLPPDCKDYSELYLKTLNPSPRD